MRITPRVCTSVLSLLYFLLVMYMTLSSSSFSTVHYIVYMCVTRVY